MDKTEWTLSQPVVIFCPSQKFYIKVVFGNDGIFNCYQCFPFDPDCILSFEEAIELVNMLSAMPQSDFGYQLLKVAKLPDGAYYIQHIISVE